MATAATPASAPEPAKGKKGGILPLLLSALVAAGGAGGGVYFMTQSKSTGAAAHGESAEAGDQGHGGASEHGGSEHGGGSAPDGAAQYLPLSPPIVVNLNDEVTMRYLQVDVELMSRSAAGIDAATLHMPRIRNTLMMLFTQQRFDDIVTREGKEKLQKEALEAVQAVLREETGKSRIDALYFTNFVMQ